MGKCKTCGENSVEEEFENGRTVHVCTDCGAIDNDSHDFITAYIEGTSFSYGQGKRPTGLRYSSNVGPKKNAGLVFGYAQTKLIGGKLHVSDSLIKEATDIYNMVFPTQLRYVTNITRTAMIGACLYCVAHRHGMAITLRDITQVLDIKCAGQKVGKALNALKKDLDITPSVLSLTNQIDYFLSKYNFSKDVNKLSHAIMTLCERYWLSQGRMLRTTLTVAIYFAWRACNFPSNKLKFLAFCEKFDLEYTKATETRKQEVGKLLQTTVSNLPWLIGQEIKDIDPYIRDAVEFQASLMQETINKAVECKAQSSNTDDTETAGETNAHNEVTIFRSKGATKKRVHDSKETAAQSTAPDLCTEDDLNLGAADDTDMYIRSEKEVKDVMSVYEMFDKRSKGDQKKFDQPIIS